MINTVRVFIDAESDLHFIFLVNAVNGPLVKKRQLLVVIVQYSELYFCLTCVHFHRNYSSITTQISPAWGGTVSQTTPYWRSVQREFPQTEISDPSISTCLMQKICVQINTMNLIQHLELSTWLVMYPSSMAVMKSQRPVVIGHIQMSNQACDWLCSQRLPRNSSSNRVLLRCTESKHGQGL